MCLLPVPVQSHPCPLHNYGMDPIASLIAHESPSVLSPGRRHGQGLRAKNRLDISWGVLNKIRSTACSPLATATLHLRLIVLGRAAAGVGRDEDKRVHGGGCGGWPFERSLSEEIRDICQLRCVFIVNPHVSGVDVLIGDVDTLPSASYLVAFAVSSASPRAYTHARWRTPPP